MISGSYDHTLKVWDVKCGQCKVTLRCVLVLLLTLQTFCCVYRGHNDAVLCLQFVGDTLVSGSKDQAIKVKINLVVMKSGSSFLFRSGACHKDNAR